MTETPVKAIRSASVSFPPLQASSAVPIGNRGEDDCLRRGTNVSPLNHSLVVLILQGQCSTSPKSPFIIVNRRTFVIECAAIVIQPGEPVPYGSRSV